MKKKYILLICFCLCFQITPLHAKEAKHILILSEQLPYIIIADIKDDDHMQVNLLPSSISIPLSCVANQCASLIDLQLNDSKDCIKDSLESFLDITIDNTIVLDIETLQDDLNLPYKDTTFSSMDGITSYFEKVVDNLNVGMLLHYQDYVSANLNLSDYYTYYQMFKGKSVSIQYAYMNYIYQDQQAIPMDNVFHLSSK